MEILNKAILSWYGVMFVHWVADFCLQTNKQAVNKSKSNFWLGQHVLVYTMVLMAPFGPKFAIANGVAHFLTDWVSSRGTSWAWKEEKRHLFFAIIGFDQFMHLSVLYATMPWIGW